MATLLKKNIQNSDRPISLSPLYSLLLGLYLIACSHQSEGYAPHTNETLKSQSQSDDHEDVTSLSQTSLSCSPPIEGWNPNSVHKMNGKQQFEGWYYRITEPNHDESWVVITAYWRDTLGETRAFIELIQGSTGATYKRVFEDLTLEDFQRQEGRFELWIGDVFFSQDRVSGHFIDENGVAVELELYIDPCAMWGAPEDHRNRWTMGWATELPGPPLKWHVHHLKGEASGRIRIKEDNDWNIDASFDRAPVHQEKNWGHAFPKRWIWMQSNLFEDRPDVAFAAAGGPIFGFNQSPSGYMMGLRWRNQFFNWRTQDGHKFAEVSFRHAPYEDQVVWSFAAENLRYRVEVTASAPYSELIAVDIPSEGGLEFGAFEHLSADVTIEIYQRDGFSWKWLDQVHSSRTAVEAGGDFAHQLN
jgi:hypothetical protein